jgi:transcriptional regulator with XRE-family HTH domain
MEYIARQSKEKFPLRRLMDSLSAFQDMETPGFGDTIAALRARLRMTQAQLAARAGLPQSHIARIESGRADVRVATLRRIFQALLCDLVILPRPLRDLDEAVEDRLKASARSRVEEAIHRMAPEDRPGALDVAQDLIGFEEARLRLRPSALRWDDEAQWAWSPLRKSAGIAKCRRRGRPHA